MAGPEPTGIIAKQGVREADILDAASVILPAEVLLCIIKHVIDKLPKTVNASTPPLSAHALAYSLLGKSPAVAVLRLEIERLFYADAVLVINTDTDVINEYVRRKKEIWTTFTPGAHAWLRRIRQVWLFTPGELCRIPPTEYMNGLLEQLPARSSVTWVTKAPAIEPYLSVVIHPFLTSPVLLGKKRFAVRCTASQYMAFSVTPTEEQVILAALAGMSRHYGIPEFRLGGLERTTVPPIRYKTPARLFASGEDRLSWHGHWFRDLIPEWQTWQIPGFFNRLQQRAFAQSAATARQKALLAANSDTNQ